MVTMMAGVILLFLGFSGLGAAVRFIPRPIVIGFTNGIALLIASTQIKDFFGLKMAENPSEFFARMKVIAAHFATTNPAALASGAGLARADSLRAKTVSASTRLDCGAAGGNAGGRRIPIAGRNHRQQIRRHQPRAAAHPHSAISRGSDSAAAAFGADGGDSGCARKPVVGRSRGLDERRSPQFQRGTGGPRVRQHREPLVRRHPRDRRDRADGDQHSLRRQDSGGRHDSRADAAWESCWCWRRWRVSYRWPRSRRCCS